jgi:hypothetical protein
MDHSELSSTDEELTLLLTVSFSEAARALGAAGGSEDTLALVLRLAVTIIDG